MFKERPLNCVGFVYKELGLRKAETYIEPPSVKKLEKYFDEVDNIEEARVVAVIAYSSREPVVGHIALINDDKKTITHRGLGSPVLTDSIDEGLEEYLITDMGKRRVIYLNPKKRSKRDLLGTLSLIYKGRP